MTPYATDPEYLAGLATIIEHRDEDWPRLMVADWLEQHGHCERAEFIRLDIRIAELKLPDGECPPGCPCGGIGKRVADLVEQYGDVWNPKLPDESPTTRYGWRRGFPDTLTLTAAAWLQHADALAWHPEHSTAVCEACGGCGRDRIGPIVRAATPCPDCHGKGHIHRPMPPTAQPIREVRLTTLPNVERLSDPSGHIRLQLPRRRSFRLVSRREMEQSRIDLANYFAPRLIAVEWPWITFTMP
jgi:uncharacterized protein (TIGR02996 family)